MRSLKSIKGLRPAAPSKFFDKYTMQEVNKLSTPELRGLVQQGARILNPRIERLEKRESTGEIATDALDYIRATGGSFSAVSEDPDKLYKTRNELLAEFKRERDFSQMTTSTVTGAKETMKQRSDIVGDTYGDDWDNFTEEEKSQKIGDAWESFHEFKARHPNIPSNDLLDIYISCNGMTDEMERRVQEWQYGEEQKWKQAYEEAERQSNYRPKWTF